jgi:beta-lactamase class A
MLTGLVLSLIFITVVKPFSSDTKLAEENKIVVDSPSPSNTVTQSENAKDTVVYTPVTAFDQLTDSIKAKSGSYSLYIKDLTTSQTYEYNADQIIYGASLYKILVGGTVYELISQNKLSLNYEYTYEGQDFTGGTGILQTQSVGSIYSIKELLDYLFKSSDNIAQNILIRNLTESAISSFYQKFVDSPAFTNQFYASGRTSAKETAYILESLHKNESWSRASRKAFFDHMINTDFDDRISRGLDSSLIFSHKIANWPDSSWHDCGIVFDKAYSNPVVVCLMSKQVDQNEFLEVAEETGRFINSLLLH